MKRIQFASLVCAFALAAAVGCSKSSDKPMNETMPVSNETPTESTTVAGSSETKSAEVLILKFHHDS